LQRNDEQLVLAAKQGDKKAFGILVDRLRTGLIGHMTGVLGHRHDAEELAQEAFILAWQKLDSVHEPAKVGAWIHRIARNLATKHAGKRRPLSLDYDLPDDSLSQPDGNSNDDSNGRVVELLAAVARLEEPHREVVARKHFDGQTGEEISKQLGIARGTVRSRLSRAYSELRRMMAPEHGEKSRTD
jgi:RNA polymerase sigma-70 factor (ECF subfamily)